MKSPNPGPETTSRTSAPVTLTADGIVEIHSHEAVREAATDPQTFSSAVSRFLQIPNGLDGQEHAKFRSLIDRYFTPEAMADFEPACRAVATDIARNLPLGVPLKAVEQIGMPFAVAAQSAWLGWPADLAEELVDWVRANQEATRSGELARTAAVAEHFDSIIHSIIEPRRGSDGTADVTDQLIHDDAAGELTDQEIVSILRNWTGGDLASIAQCTGVILHHLARRPEVAERVAQGASDAEVDAILEEFLRIDDPFVSNRRVATADTEIGGCPVAGGQKVILNWADANRDPAVFGDPDAFDPDGNAQDNLVYGIGPHVCPGRPLARLELREVTRAILAVGIPEPARDSEREAAPMGGFRVVPVVLKPRG